MLSEGCVKYDFTGGNNDPDRLPLDGLTAPADAVLKREGRSLSTYGLNSGPQGYLALREFLVAKLKAEAPLPVGRSAKSSCLRPRHFPQKPSQPPYLDERKLVVGCGLGGASRELGQREFNRRVPALAADPRVPALERLCYLCIGDSNICSSCSHYWQFVAPAFGKIRGFLSRYG